MATEDPTCIHALIDRYDGLGAAYQPHVKGYMFFVLEQLKAALDTADSFKAADLQKRRRSDRPNHLRLVKARTGRAR